jgi:hypothetical protein
MKQNKRPTDLKSGNYLEQGCLEGLSEAGKKYAKAEIKDFENKGYCTVPYGLIRKIALTK